MAGTAEKTAEEYDLSRVQFGFYVFMFQNANRMW